MASTPRAVQDLPTHLESRLRAGERLARILGIGCPAPIRRRLARSGDLWAEEVAADLDPGPFDAMVWNAGEAEAVAPAVEILRRRLTGAGKLAVIIPAEGDARAPAGKRRGGLASKDQPILRRIVRGLSEAGFVVGGERRFDGGPGWAAVVARRDPFRVRAYRPGDEDAILELFPTCFHARRSPEHWRWKYLGNPYGTLKISMAFAPGEELAAHYASYPMPFRLEGPDGGRDLLALQMGDTMTAPAFREEGRGRNALLPRTVRHFFAVHRDGVYGFYYGFNTGSIQRFCEWFIGGSLIAPVSYWTLDLADGTPLAPGPERYRVRRALRTDAGWTRLFQRAAPHYRFLVRRDAKWVEWRYLSCPDADFVVLAATCWGRLVGWSVFRRRDDLLIWGDALFDPRHAGAAETILASAVRHPALAGARRLAAWFSPRPSWWSERLPGLGLRAAPEPDGLGMVALEDGEADAIEKLRGLYYTMGDGDLF